VKLVVVNVLDEDAQKGEIPNKHKVNKNKISLLLNPHENIKTNQNNKAANPLNEPKNNSKSLITSQNKHSNQTGHNNQTSHNNQISLKLLICQVLKTLLTWS
jgi:hypothetical protein